MEKSFDFNSMHRRGGAVNQFAAPRHIQEMLYIDEGCFRKSSFNTYTSFRSRIQIKFNGKNFDFNSMHRHEGAANRFTAPPYKQWRIVWLTGSQAIITV